MTVDEIYGQMVEAFQQETGITLAGDGDMAVRLYAVLTLINEVLFYHFINILCIPPCT